VLDFVPSENNLDTFTAFVAGLKAFAGGHADIPEDVHGGLDAAGKLSWNAPARLIMHFCDAPGHGLVELPDAPSIRDNFPQGDPAGEEILQAISVSSGCASGMCLSTPAGLFWRSAAETDMEECNSDQTCMG
jgi:hypothetical protein